MNGKSNHSSLFREGFLCLMAISPSNKSTTISFYGLYSYRPQKWHQNVQNLSGTTSCRRVVSLQSWQFMTSISVEISWKKEKTNGPLLSSKTITFKMRPSAQPFLWKWVLFAWEWKIISISKAEHLTSFWNRGLGELGNGLLRYHYVIYMVCTLIEHNSRPISALEIAQLLDNSFYIADEIWET